jgi:hypothetical protein
MVGGTPRVERSTPSWGHPIRIEGWYYAGAGMSSYPDLSRYLIDDKVFKLTVKTHLLEDLEILPLERIQGSFWTPVQVTAIVNVSQGPSGAVAPFFIRKEKVVELKKLIEKYREDSDHLPL